MPVTMAERRMMVKINKFHDVGPRDGVALAIRPVLGAGVVGVGLAVRVELAGEGLADGVVLRLGLVAGELGIAGLDAVVAGAGDGAGIALGRDGAGAGDCR